MTTQGDIVALMPQLRAFARSLAQGDPQFADDLVQDTVVLALQAWDKFTPGTNLKAWLLTILRNRFHSLTRRNRFVADMADEDLERRLTVRPTQDVGLETAAFKRAFARLSVPHREILVLIGVHGLAYEQVAEICNCEIGTVKSRVFRARELLKKALFGEVPSTSPAQAAASRRSVRSPARRPASLAATARAKATPPRTASPGPAPAAIVPAHVAPAPAVPLPVTPILAVPSAPGSLHIVAGRHALGVVEGAIGRAETQLTRYLRVHEHMLLAGADLTPVGEVLRLAELRLVSLNSHRAELLAQLDWAPSATPA